MARSWTLTALTSAAALAVAAGALAPPAQATTAATVAPATATPAAHQRTVWQPAEDTGGRWELSQPLNLSSPRLMGTGVTAWNGDTAPGDNPALYDIDGIINPASTVAKLHAMSDHVVCYIE